jgi:hypothetical protein
MQKDRSILTGVISAFFLVATLAAGLVLFYFGSAVWQVVEARSWVPVSCRILSAEVRYSRGLPEIDIRYEYEVAQRGFESTRYRFLGGSSDAQHNLPEEHRAGSTATCFVDPDNPSQAVIVRGFTWDMLFGLIPLFFFVLLVFVSYGIVLFWFGKPAPEDG